MAHGHVQIAGYVGVQCAFSNRCVPVTRGVGRQGPNAHCGVGTIPTGGDCHGPQADDQVGGDYPA